MKKSAIPSTITIIGCFLFLFAIIALLANKLGEMTEQITALKETANKKQNAEEAQKKARAKQKEKEKLEAKSIKDMAAVLHEVTKEHSSSSVKS